MLSGSSCSCGSPLVWPTARTRESNPGCWHCGDGSGDSLCCWLELHLKCVSLPAICTLCLSVCLSLTAYLAASFKISNQKTQSQSDLWNLHLWSHLQKFQIQGILVLVNMCHLLLRQWKWMCACEFSASFYRFIFFVCLCFPRSRETLTMGYKSRYPRYPHQSACYYFIRLISGCHPLSPSFALLRRSFSFQQRQWPVYPAVLSKCQVLSTLLLIYSLKCSRGWGIDIHLPESVYMCATWYNSSQVMGSSFPTCIVYFYKNLYWTCYFYKNTSWIFQGFYRRVFKLMFAKQVGL